MNAVHETWLAAWKTRGCRLSSADAWQLERCAEPPTSGSIPKHNLYLKNSLASNTIKNDQIVARIKKKFACQVVVPQCTTVLNTDRTIQNYSMTPQYYLNCLHSSTTPIYPTTTLPLTSHYHTLNTPSPPPHRHIQHHTSKQTPVITMTQGPPPSSSSRNGAENGITV